MATSAGLLLAAASGERSAALHPIPESCMGIEASSEAGHDHQLPRSSIPGWVPPFSMHKWLLAVGNNRSRQHDRVGLRVRSRPVEFIERDELSIASEGELCACEHR